MNYEQLFFSAFNEGCIETARQMLPRRQYRQAFKSYEEVRTGLADLRRAAMAFIDLMSEIESYPLVSMVRYDDLTDEGKEELKKAWKTDYEQH